MTTDSPNAITTALETAGWTPDAPHPGLLPKLTHDSGITLRVMTDDGGCVLELLDGLSVTFLGNLPSPVVIAACLAAAGQLDPSRDRVRLEEESDWLGWLDAAGLDNWPGVDEAREMRAAHRD